MGEGLDKISSPDTQEAIEYIQSIEGEVWSMGVNDAEIPALRKLQENIKSGLISPIEAKKQASEILERKIRNNYH